MQNVDRDIIVIGAGGSGLMATLVAAKNGARVLLLEKTDMPGGGTAFSSKGSGNGSQVTGQVWSSVSLPRSRR
jgi:succinate dehydrogenase/fumarate reductase flavoprotein subunit